MGGGLRFDFSTSKEKHTFYFGLGGFYSREHLDITAGSSEKNKESIWRGNIYLLLDKKLNESAKTYSTTYLQPDLFLINDYRLLEVVGIKIAINKSLSLNLNLELTYDSRPPLSVKNTDLNYVTGFEYSFH